MTPNPRFYEAVASGARRSAPAALRNREPISKILREWLPPSGVVLELASGTGEHAVYFAQHFPDLEWQPSDIHPDALASIAAWRKEAALENVREGLAIDASRSDWPVDRTVALQSIPSARRGGEEAAESIGFDAVLNLNMVHISPWSAALGLLDGAATLLKRGGALILYGPWLKSDIETAPSNLAFDLQLRERDPQWGLRRVEEFEAEALKRDFLLEEVREMPANNLMLLFRLGRDAHLSPGA